ncbi:MAG TPA: M23 family metallopeptidase [Acidobacteriaceae bacterium]|nr:M23 family metallopeptidase [Acidobacteriaceae bacterium]
MRKHHYIVYVSRDGEGQLRKVPIPMRYAYAFVAAAVVGLFTITGLAGSYGRMLVKAERFNQIRSQQLALRQQYHQLEQDTRQKDMQVASLGSLASEVSALYGLRQSKLVASKSSTSASSANVSDETNYYQSLDRFYALRNSALSGIATQALSSGMHAATLTEWVNLADAPSLWPVMGRVTSSFGERTDPFGADMEGEFHRGIDIAAPNGTAIHATGDGVVASAGWGTGYGREVVLDHGHGITTLYAHMASIAVTPGETVSRGQVIGYVGMSGHSTGAHVHYEVRIHNTPVNPHRYMRETMAQMAATEVPQGAGE